MEDTYEFKSWTVRRQNVEQELGRSMTDEEFEKFVTELDGRMDNFCTELYNDLIDQIKEGTF